MTDPSSRKLAEIKERHAEDDERSVEYCNRWRDTDQPYDSLRAAHSDRATLLSLVEDLEKQKAAAISESVVLRGALYSHNMGTSFAVDGTAHKRHCLLCDATWDASDAQEHHKPDCVLATTPLSLEQLEYVKRLEAENTRLKALVDRMYETRDTLMGLRSVQLGKLQST